MHFATPLIVLSAAATAMASSFAAPAHPAGLANRQTTKEQILRRQAHGMQRVKRQGGVASVLPTDACGAPAAFVIQISGVQTEDVNKAALNNGYAIIASDPTLGNTITGTQSLAEASIFSTEAANNCALTSGGLIADSDGSDNAPVYMDTPEDLAAFGATALSCTVAGSGDLSCIAGAGTTFKLCTNEDRDENGNLNRPISYFIGLNGATNTVAGCDDVTLTVFRA